MASRGHRTYERWYSFSLNAQWGRQSVAIRGHRTYERWYSFSLNARTAASLNSSATAGASAELGLSSGRVFGGTYLWGSGGAS